MKENYSQTTKDEFRAIIKSYYIKSNEVGNITNPEEMLNYATLHQLNSIFYYMLLNQKDKINNGRGELMSRYLTSIKSSALKARESKNLDEYLKKNNVKHSFIKGQFIKDFYYPHEVRSMGDIDIFVPDDKLLKPYFDMEGYSQSEYYAEVTTYKKDRIEFEVHKEIEWFGIDWAPLCTYTKEGVFDNRSQAMLLIVHAMKHLVMYGLGIRQVLDIAIMLREDSSILEDKIFLDKLKELKIYNCYNSLLALINSWFDTDYKCNSSIEAVEVLSNAIENGGVFGFNLNDYATINTVSHKSKFKMYMRMLFPKYDRMVLSYPVLKEKKYLLGYYYMKRLFTRGLKEKRYKIMSRTSDESSVENRKKFVEVLDIEKQYYNNL